MKVIALEGAFVEAFSDRFPNFTAVHQCAEVSVSVSSQCSRSSQYVEVHERSVSWLSRK